jgi:hypothetical protein
MMRRAWWILGFALACRPRAPPPDALDAAVDSVLAQRSADPAARRKEQQERERFAATVSVVKMLDLRMARGDKLSSRDEETWVHSDDQIRERRAGFIAACRGCADAASCEREAREVQLQPDVARYWNACP